MPKNERGVKCQSKVFKIVGKTAADCQYTFSSGLHVIHDQGYSEHSQDKNGSHTWNVGFFWKQFSFFEALDWLMCGVAPDIWIIRQFITETWVNNPFPCIFLFMFFPERVFSPFPEQNVGIFWLHKFTHMLQFCPHSSQFSPCSGPHKVVPLRFFPLS